MTFRPSTRPITRRPPTRPPELPAGMLRIKGSLRCYLHQLKPGAADALALRWFDLWAERDERVLDHAVKSRLALRETAGYLVDRFDASDAVPVARPTRPAPPRSFTDPPAGLEMTR